MWYMFVYLRRIVIVVIIFWVWFLFAPQAYSFSCSPPSPIMERLDDAEYVFYWEILEVEYLWSACNTSILWAPKYNVRLAQINDSGSWCKKEKVKYLIKNIWNVQWNIGDKITLNGVVWSTLTWWWYSCYWLKKWEIYRIMTNGGAISTCWCGKDAEKIDNIEEIIIPGNTSKFKILSIVILGFLIIYFMYPIIKKKFNSAKK
jgi:hypothetical protein